MKQQSYRSLFTCAAKLKSKRCIDLNSFCVEVCCGVGSFSSLHSSHFVYFFLYIRFHAFARRVILIPFSIFSRRYKSSGGNGSGARRRNGANQMPKQNEKLVQTQRRGGNKWIKLATSSTRRAYETNCEHLVAATAAATAHSQRNEAKQTKQSFPTWAFIYAFNERE